MQAGVRGVRIVNEYCQLCFFVSHMMLDTVGDKEAAAQKPTETPATAKPEPPVLTTSASPAPTRSTQPTTKRPATAKPSDRVITPTPVRLLYTVDVFESVTFAVWDNDQLDTQSLRQCVGDGTMCCDAGEEHTKMNQKHPERLYWSQKKKSRNLRHV